MSFSFFIQNFIQILVSGKLASIVDPYTCKTPRYVVSDLDLDSLALTPYIAFNRGAQWLSGRVLGPRVRSSPASLRCGP